MHTRFVSLLGALIACVLFSGMAAAAAGYTGISRAELHSVNGSGQTGEVALADTPAGGAQVDVTLHGGSGQPQPVAIYPGTCELPSRQAAYVLHDVVNGQSQTTLNAHLSDLLGGRYVVAVSKSASEDSTFVACGQLTAFINGGVRPPSTTGNGPGKPPVTLPNTGRNPDIRFLLLGTGLLLLAVAAIIRRAVRRT